ncbi:MAG TPA: hypothetical protein VFE23_17035 [Usitatibacter sp.]|jgi:rhodanese-related sulfurtransferase|nr:hypothetical protein [Usitatibacter sp.]
MKLIDESPLFLMGTLVVGYISTAFALAATFHAPVAYPDLASSRASEVRVRHVDRVFVVAVHADDKPRAPAEKLSAPDPYILVCDSIASGRTVAAALYESGYSRVSVLDGAAPVIARAPVRRERDAGVAPHCVTWQPFGAIG